MIITDEMKNLKVYKRPLWLPTTEDSKKKGSAVFLLSPNYLSSKGMMMNPLLINKKRFESYYIEKDLTYFIKTGKVSTSEAYIRDYTEADTYINLMEMSAAEREKLPDRKFGLPSQRKYPLDTREHVMSAIKFFNYVKKEDEAELAKNLNRAIDYFCDSGELPRVGKGNRFYKYYDHRNDECYGEHLESAIVQEVSRSDILDKAISTFKDLGMKPNVSKDTRKKWVNGGQTDFGDHLCIAGLGTENLTRNCREVNKVLKPLGARVTADNYGTAFLSVKEAKIDDSSLNERRIVSSGGFYDEDGLYNAIVKLENDENRFRGRSEMIILDGDKIFLDPKADGVSFRIPGGGWDEYEDHLLTAIREAQEEARIVVKDPIYMGHYVGFYDQKWKRNPSIPDELRWQGYYTELYVGTYEKRYDGRVEIIDRDTMADTGKFYPISEVFQYLRPAWQDAITQYLNHPITESTVVVENVIFNKDNTYFNFDKFENGESNVLLVTGLSESGKSTLTRSLAEKYHAEEIELDIFECNKSYTDENLIQAGDVFVEYLLKGAGKNYRERSIAGNPYKGEENAEEIKKFIQYLFSYTKKHKEKKFIIEGVQIYSMMSSEEISSYPLIIVGTSLKNSILQRFKRNAGGGSIQWGKELKNEFGNLLAWYWDEEKQLSRFSKSLSEKGSNLFNEQNDQDLTKFSYYHAELVRPGFNPKLAGNWDEELYYKDLKTAIRKPYGTSGGNLTGDYRVHLYTLGDEFSPVYLGVCSVRGVDDWEWDNQSDLSPEEISYLRDEVQRGTYRVTEDYEINPSMEETEYLSQVGEVVLHMITSNCEYFVPFGKFIPYEDGLAVGTMNEESSSTLVALINEKLKSGIFQNYHVESHGAEIGIDYLVVKKNNTSINTDFNDKVDQIKDEIFEAPKMVAEDGSVIDTTKWVQSIVPSNTPDTAIHSVSALIPDYNGSWLLLDHVKCHGYTLPGGKIDEGENAGQALKRELFEELGIVPTEYHHYLTNTFLCNYPKGTDSFVYFTDHCFNVVAYTGEIRNKESEKHKEILYMHPDAIAETFPDLSELLKGVLAERRMYSTIRAGSHVILPSSITYSGFEDEVRLLSHMCTTRIYEEVLASLGLSSIVQNHQVPILHFIAGRNDDITYEQNHHVYITMNMENLEELESRPKYFYDACCYMMIVGLLGSLYPQSRNTALPQMIAEYLCGGPGFITDYRRDMITTLIERHGINKIVALLPGGDVQSFHKMAQKEGLGYESAYDYLKEAKVFDAEALTRKVKYSTTKLKRKNGKARNKAKNLLDKVVDDIQKKTEVKVPDATPSAPSSKGVQSVTEILLMETALDTRMQIQDFMIIFEDAKYDQKLKSILYADRLVQRKDVIALYDQVKSDCDFIKYTYPDLSRYQGKNLFVDLYFYNEVFFKNNDWKLNRGFDLYFDLLDRLLNDKRISTVYKKKTVFVPILDWDKNKSTRMWMYKEDINPISIIYNCMMNNPARLKLFKDMDLIFFGGGRYFKMNFTQITEPKKAAQTFLKFVKKIRNGEAFDPGDEEIETAETKKAIQTDLIDKIEDSKGVDLTGTIHKVQKQRADAMKDAEKRSKRNVIPSPDLAPVEKGRTKKDEVEEPETDDTVKSKLSQEPNPEDQVEKRNKELLARAIDDVISDPNLVDGDDALDRLDTEYVKDLLLSIDSDDDQVKISQARADRMMQLDRDLLDKQVKGKSVREILDEKKTQKPLSHTELKISSPNEQWKDLEYINYGKKYDKDADIIKAFQHFSQVSRPLVVREIEVVDNSTSEDNVELYTVSLEDYRGTRYKVKLDIPVLNNRNRWKLRGGERNIQAQFANLPILKTDLDSAQVVSNYNKIIVTRFNTSSGRSMPQVSKFLKAANKYEGKKITFSTGNNTQICAKYNLPIDYIDLSSVFSKIETPNQIFYFDQDEIRKLYPIDESVGIPVAYNKMTKEVVYMDAKTFSDMNCFVSFMIQQMTIHDYKDCKDFLDAYDDAIPVNRGTYSRASIMSSKIPLVVVCAYSEGLTTVMKKANITYYLRDKLTSAEKRDPYYSYVKYKDGYILYRATYAACLLMNGLKDCSTEMYSIGEIDDRNMYLDFLDNFGGRIKADGLDNAYDCTIDPITKEMLEFYKLPTDYITVLLYTNILLADNKFIKHTDSGARRLRREELIAAYTYKVLAEAYRIYANELKHGGSRTGFSVKQSAVIDKFLLDNTSSNSSVINMLNDVETANAVTTKGLSGMNSERAYSLDKRTYDESMLNNIALSTGFAGNVGITRQATMNMNVATDRGFVKTINGDTSKMNTANTLCATEAMIPFCTTHDDTMRIAMSFIQTSKHAVRIEDSDPLLVTNGADEALPYLASDLFAHKAKGDGVVKEITDSYIILEYKDGTKEYVNLESTIENNSDGGFYCPLKLDVAEKIKVGSKVKAGDVVAYDRQSISNTVGESDNLAYNVGKLSKVALINTDEGFEDSGVVREGMSEKLATHIIEKEDVILDKNTNVFNMVKVGTDVEEGDTLLVWQNPYDEEDANAILKMMANDQEAVSELGRHRIKSPLTGKVVGIKIYRTVEIEELSESLQKVVKDYERPIKALKKKLDAEGINSKGLPATYALEPSGNLKNARDAVKIEFYIDYNDIVAVGDKIVYMAANKAVIKNVIPDSLAPYTDFRPNEPIDAMVSVTSIAKRMVTSIPIYGALQKLMVELDRSCKDLAGIPYDDSTV